jgi:lysophospholipase L1-like esterase
VAGALVLAGAVAASVAAARGPSSTTTTTTTTSSTVPTTVPQPTWRVAWGSAMAWGYGVAANTTVRDVVQVGVGGSAIRIRVSNAFGNAPLVVGAATVAQSAGGADVVPGTMTTVDFSGAPTATIPVGQLLTSDPVALPVTARETLAVSLYVSNPELVTVHPCCTTVRSFAGPNNTGNLTASPNGKGLAIADGWERWFDAVDVLQMGGTGSIAVLGDSISDGFNATDNWVSILQQRIDDLPAAEQRAVVDEGISANALTSVVRTDSLVGGGPSGLDRMARDVTSQAGVTEMVLELGTNDLFFGATAAQLIQGYEQIVQAAHAAGLRIVATTLLPRAANPKEAWTPSQQAELEQVDGWIRSSGAFDGVIDFAPIVADVYNGDCAPNLMLPAYDSGDHLHPNAAGATAMADAVDGNLLQIGPLPQVPPLVTVTKTRNCNAALSPAPLP